MDYEIVDVSTIPEKPPRVSKYDDLLKQAKKLEGTQALRIVESKDVKISSIAPLMYKLKLKVTNRTENKKKVLYISLKTE